MFRKRPLEASLRPALVWGTLLALRGLAYPADGQGVDDVASKIESAMSAAPAAVSADATILDYEREAAGDFVVLQQGGNGWWCFPDAPSTPSADPMCFDRTWLTWFYARLAGSEPVVNSPGLAYMLQGGSSASNTDPFATAPAPGEEWIDMPPHLLVLLPGPFEQSTYELDPSSGVPSIAFAGTPYAHLIVPVFAAKSS
jgi:hypothetical protein